MTFAPTARPKRINRWRSLLIASNKPFEAYEYRRSVSSSVRKTENWMQNPSQIAPNLRYLTLRMVPTDWIPHKDFAPNLTRLTLEDISGEVEHPIINTSSIKSLSLQRGFPSPIYWDRLLGICPVEELSLGEFSSVPRMTINLSFPGLRRLRLREDVSPSIVIHIAEELSNSGRRLEVLHLVNVTLVMFEFYSKETHSSILANTRKIIFENLSYFGPDADKGMEPERNGLSTHDIETFLEELAPGAEIVVMGL